MVYNVDVFGPITVPQGKLWVMGDSRKNSRDSRYWGFLDSEGITKFGPSFSHSYPEEIETKLGGLYVGMSYLFDINNVE